MPGTFNLIAILAAASAQDAPARHNDMFAAFSPDGTRIVFTSDRGGDPEIYVADRDGTNLVRLTHAPGRDAHPAFSPDGRTIAFQSPRSGADTRLYTMRADGSEQRLLVETRGFCGVPIWSRDGARIAFQCGAHAETPGEGDAPWRLFVVNADGSGLRQISHGPGNDQVPSWTTDGDLVFHSNRSGSDQLYRLDLDSGAVAALTEGPAVHEAPVVSPDGTTIALVRTEGEASRIAVLDRATGAVRALLDPGWRYAAAQWAPDGTALLYQAPTPRGVRLHLLPLAGGAPTVLEPE